MYIIFSQATSKLEEFDYYSLFVNDNLLYNCFSGGCFVLMVILQAVILVGIIKPIHDHYIKSTVSNNLNNTVDDNLYKNIFCSLMLSSIDICLILFYTLGVKKNLLRAPMLVISYLILNVIFVVCSYKDCRERLFPYRNLF